MLRFPSIDGTSDLVLYPIGESAASDVIVEGGTYKFRLLGLGPPVTFEPSELLSFDPDDRTMGRFTPLNHVGTISVVAEMGEGREVRFDIDVAPAKLTHEAEYRSLLEQVADYAAEAVLQGFAPATRSVSASTHEAGELEYRSLAFVAARLRDDAFQSAVNLILQNPHRRWSAVSETRRISRGLPAGAEAARQLTRPGRPSRAVPDALDHLPVGVLPDYTEHTHNEISYDTNPNRFVRFVFRHWMGLALNIEQRLAASTSVGAGPRRRGLTEARWITEQCDRVLRSAPLRDVSELRQFPHGDPVLLRQPGYREILRVFALAEASMSLDTALDDDIFSPTQRNIATLYEYWCFLVLVRCLTQMCGEPTTGSLFTAASTGLSLVLHEGSKSLMSWIHEQDGRRLAVDLWFNQTFSRAAADGVEISSWASSLRPDASLRIRPLSGRPRETLDPYLDTWLHFDAKFRLDIHETNLTENDPTTTAKRADLLKMHAYRDLIRRSAGAYVLYPGFGGPQRQAEFHEVLPGIGAFPLRPDPNGDARGSDALIEFLRETLDLTANQASSNERMRFWNQQHTRRGRPVQAVSFLSAPPADELVLLGYVRTDQWPWVTSTRRYNLRGDDRHSGVRTTDEMLSARLVLLWTHDSLGQPQVVQLFERTGPWQIVLATDLAASGYPSRVDAKTYLVAEINPVASVVDAMVAPVDTLPISSDGAPTSTTWEQIARSSGTSHAT